MRVAGPALDYLSPTFGDGSGSPQAEDGEGSEVRYELTPTLRNVARTCGLMLGAESAPEWLALEDLAAWWNDLPEDDDGPVRPRPLGCLLEIADMPLHAAN